MFLAGIHESFTNHTAAFLLVNASRRLALAHKLFHARDLDFDAFAEVLNPGG